MKQKIVNLNPYMKIALIVGILLIILINQHNYQSIADNLKIREDEIGCVQICHKASSKQVMLHEAASFNEFEHLIKHYKIKLGKVLTPSPSMFDITVYLNDGSVRRFGVGESLYVNGEHYMIKNNGKLLSALESYFIFVN